MRASRRSGPAARGVSSGPASGPALAAARGVDFADSAYAHFGALQMARIAVETGDLELAETELRWTLDNDVSESLEPIVRMRLAQVVAAQGRLEQALLLLPALICFFLLGRAIKVVFLIFFGLIIIAICCCEPI